MKKYLIICLLCILSISRSTAQVFPAKGDTLNQTQILFDVPHSPDAAKYEIQISRRKDFAPANIVAKMTGPSSQFIISSGLEFRRIYFWRYLYYKKGGTVIFTSPLYYFHVLGNDLTDTVLYHNTITINKKGKYLDGYIVSDRGGILDRAGNVIWTLPANANYTEIRDLRLNKDGNLTFTDSKNSYEINLKGCVLWQSPHDIDSLHLRFYHHEITKLDNGNFLCVAEKAKADKRKAYNVAFELTPDNKVNRIWDEENFYPERTQIKAHLNSAMLDEKTGDIYLSDRNINAITKANFKTGETEYFISSREIKGISPYYENNIFSGQHDVSLTKKGDLLMFNNNASKLRHGVSSVLVISQPSKDKKPEIKWEFVCQFGGDSNNFLGKMGGVDELSNGNFLVGMEALARIFEVNKKKKIVWECITGKLDTVTKTYKPYGTGYRTDFVTTLYPRRFIAYTDSIKNALVIENTGIYADSYSYITNDQQPQTTTTIDPRKTLFIPLKDYKNINSIKINSVANPDVVKTITISQ